MAILQHVIRLCCLALFVLSCAAEEQASELLPARPLAALAPEVVAAAEWAVTELQKLSASNIYTTLSLAVIDDVGSSDGVYHANTFLNQALTSRASYQKKALLSWSCSIRLKATESTYIFAALSLWVLQKLIAALTSPSSQLTV
jgi:hypothetical protein